MFISPRTAALLGSTAHTSVTITIFVDPDSGSDSNDGLTQATPLASFAPIQNRTHSKFGSGMVVGVKAGSAVMRDTIDFAEPNAGNGNTTLSNFTVIGYGTGQPRKISCLDVAANASFAPHATILNAYTISWNHFLYATATGCFRVFDAGEPLKRVSTEAATSTAGTYWFSSVTTPGTPATIVIHPWDDSSPILNGRIYEITKRQYAVSGRDNVTLEYLYGYAGGNNNGAIFTYDNPTARALLVEEGRKHCWVMGPGHFTDVIALNAVNSTDYNPDGSILGTVFLADPSNKTSYLKRCAYICDPTVYAHSDAGKGASQPFYAHGSSGAPDMITYDSCWDVNTGNSGGGQSIGVTFINHFSYIHNVANSAVYNETVGSTVTVRGGCAIGVPRDFSAGYQDISGWLSIKSAAGPTSYQPLGLKLVDSTLLNSAGTSPAVDMTIDNRNVEIQRNVVSKNFGGWQLTRTAADATSIIIDYNCYARFNSNDGTGGAYIVKYAGTAWSYATTQSNGYEAHGYNTVSAPATDWTSATHPSTSSLDIRLNAGGGLAAHVPSPIAQSVLDAYLALPRTKTDVLTYIQTVPRSTITNVT